MCWKCGKAIQSEFPIGRSMTCSSCNTDVRVCKNCRFYSVGSSRDCAERIEELVKDKERANFCDNFQLNPAYKSDHAGIATFSKTSFDHRSAFDNLFK